MATWIEISTAFRHGSLPASQVGDDGWSLEVLDRGGQKRQVYIFHETVGSGMELLRVSAFVSFEDSIDIGAMFKQVGTFVTGGLSYAPQTDANGNSTPGLITFGSSFPLHLISLTDMNILYVYINTVSNSAAAIQSQYLVPKAGNWQEWLRSSFPKTYINSFGSSVTPYGRTIVLCKSVASPTGDPMISVESPFLLDIPTTPELYELIAVSSRQPKFGCLVTAEGNTSSQICLAVKADVYLEGLSIEQLRKTVNAIGTEALESYDNYRRIVEIGGHLNL